MLPEKLTTLRKEKGLSQNELAEMLYVTRQAVSRWETGEAAPSVDNLIALRDLYGVSVDYLLFDEGEEGEPGTPAGPVKAVSPPVPGRPRRVFWMALALSATAVVVSAAALLLTFYHVPEKGKVPLAALDGNGVVINKDGETAKGEVIEISEDIFITVEPVGEE